MMKRLLFGIAILFSLSSGVFAACPSGSSCTQYNGTVPYDATGGTTARTPAARALDQDINILEYGADLTDTNDSTAAIQAASDYAFTRGNGATICPSGQYKTSLPIFVDPPGNMRGANGTYGQTYSGRATYSQYATVNYNGTAYISLVSNNTGNTPASSPSDWRRFAWSSGTTYNIGDFASYDGVPWVSLSPLTGLTLTAGGAGYYVGEILTVVGGGALIPAQISVASIGSGGAIATFTILSGGSYNATASSFTLTGNIGYGATFGSPTWNSNTGNPPTSDLGTSQPVYWTPAPVPTYSFSQSARLRGVSTVPNHGDGYGCVIKPTFNNAPVLFSSTGSGNEIQRVSIIPPTPKPYNGDCGVFATTGIGVAIPGGSGGASWTELDNVEVNYLFAGIETGIGNGALADSNKFSHLQTNWTCVGVWFSATQNFINTIIDSNISGEYGTYAPMGTMVNIIGGNHSPTEEGGPYNQFSISSTSSLSYTAAENPFNNVDYGFSTTVASPDLFLNACTIGNSGNPPLCPYNTFIIVTPNFGIIPLVLANVNTTTGVAQFEIDSHWSASYFYQTNAVTSADLQNEIQAATTLYATQMPHIWSGCHFNVYGSFVEFSVPITMLDTGCGFGSVAISLVSGVQLNNDPALTNSSPGAGALSSGWGLFYATQVFPTIHIAQQNASFKGIDWTAGASNFLISNDGSFNPSFALNSNLTSVNVQTIIQDNDNQHCPAENAISTIGCGSWDVSPFRSEAGLLSDNYRQSGYYSVPFFGWYPAPGSTPRLSTSQLSTLSGTLPSISPTSVSYPLLNGNSIYQIVNMDGTITSTGCTGGTGSATSCLFAKSAHTGYSYGQNLTTSNVSGLSWSYKGQGFWVYMDANSLSMMFAGLVIGLNNGSSTQYVTVTGVYPNACKAGVCTIYNGYVTVSALLQGTKTTVYTGNEIYQQAYAITQYPYLLRRDLDPADNDNTPAFVDKVA